MSFSKIEKDIYKQIKDVEDKKQKSEDLWKAFLESDFKDPDIIKSYFKTYADLQKLILKSTDQLIALQEKKVKIDGGDSGISDDELEKLYSKFEESEECVSE